MNVPEMTVFYEGRKMEYGKTTSFSHRNGNILKNYEKAYKMSIPEWLRKDKERVPAIPVDPEVKKAIQRYKDHFGKFDIDLVYFRPFEEIVEIIDYCIKMDICYQELYPRDPNAIY